MEDIFEAIVRLRREGKRGALATIVSVHGSTPSRECSKMLFVEDGSVVGTVGGGCVEAEVWEAARTVMAEDKARTLKFNLNSDPRFDNGMVCGGTLEVFVEPLVPPSVAFVFGAGHVGLNVYKAARLAGFEVVVVDDRPAFASAERFPDARAVHAGELPQVFPTLQVPANAAIVIATRGHKDDLQVLRWAVTTPARYVGMLGSRRKVLTLFKTLEQEGVKPEVLERVRAPIGVGIGSTTPEEIAISIVAELIAVKRGAELGRPRRPTLPPHHEAAASPAPVQATA